MKRMMICALFIIALTAAFSEENPWVLKAIACSTEAQANLLIPDLAQAGLVRDLCLGIVYHNLARSRSEVYSEKASALLQAYADRTGDAIALGYSGSAFTLRGNVFSRRGDFINAGAAVNDGFRRIDEAVRRAPDSVILRILRATNGIEVSAQSPFKRYDTVREDIAFLEAPGLTLQSAERSELYFLKGKLFLAERKVAEAAGYFEQAVRTDPGSPAASAARRELLMLSE